ncbi:MAG: glycosyltransferase family 39 protein [Caldilineaceae bacterium]|nr:glycosyltransferase family 39 protein [Caldilineaceae bacterium]
MFKRLRLHHASQRPTRVRLLPAAALAVLCLALLLRAWQLTYHSIWFDEAVSLQWARSDPSFIWQKTFPLLEEKHPPIYFLALHYWRELLGWVGLANHDGALRLLGSLFGTATVWGIMRLAQRLSGATTGLLTGLLVALAQMPVLVWYSQELRMFQPATTGLVWGAYCLWGAWESPSWRRALGWWLGMIIAFTAALYSYLFSAFLMPAAGLTLLALPFLAPRSDRWQRFWSGVLALGLTGALFLPLAINAWLVNGSEGDPGQAFANGGTTLWRLLRIFTLWRVDWSPVFVAGALALFAIFIITGLLVTRRPAAQPPAPPARLFLWLWIGLPLLIGNLLLSRSNSVFAEDRYFIFVAPFVLWALARGIVQVGARWSWLGIGSSLVVIVLLAAALPRLWSPAMYRENWRAASDYITAYHAASPGLPDTVVAHVDYTRLSLEWYLRQAYAFEALPLYFPYGGQITPDQAESVIAPPLEGIVQSGAATLWLTQSHLEGVDEDHLVEGWLQNRFPLVTELYPSGIKLSGFALQSRFTELPRLSTNALYPATELAPGLELVACEVLTPRVAAQDDQMHPPSGWVHLRLWWRAREALTDNYIATAEVVGPEGAWGVRLYRENESLRRWPTSTWSVGAIIRDEIDINLNPVTPARIYPVLIGLMDGSGQPREAKATCGAVEIQ